VLLKGYSVKNCYERPHWSPVIYIFCPFYPLYMLLTPNKTSNPPSNFQNVDHTKMRLSYIFWSLYENFPYNCYPSYNFMPIFTSPQFHLTIFDPLQFQNINIFTTLLFWKLSLQNFTKRIALGNIVIYSIDIYMIYHFLLRNHSLCLTVSWIINPS